MKAKELMIGDWVLCDRNAQSDYEFDNVDYQPYQIANGEDIDYAFEQNMIGDADVYQPIPLTAEILERNGFEVQDQGGGRRDVWIGFGVDCEGDIEVEFQYNIPTHLKIDGVFKGEYYTSTNIKYVHLLQHALKLCGIEKEIEL